MHSTVTAKGQTTIPGSVRQALNIKPGDRLEYAVEGNRAIIHVHQGAYALKGALANGKISGRGMTFTQIREAATKAALRKGRLR